MKATLKPGTMKTCTPTHHYRVRHVPQYAMSLREVAKLLNMPVTSVASIEQRALRKLREALADMNQGERT